MMVSFWFPALKSFLKAFPIAVKTEPAPFAERVKIELLYFLCLRVRATTTPSHQSLYYTTVIALLSNYSRIISIYINHYFGPFLEGQIHFASLVTPIEVLPAVDAGIEIKNLTSRDTYVIFIGVKTF